MSEMIDPTTRTAPAIFLINVMSKESDPRNLLSHFKIDQVEGQPTLVNVELKINGVEVDFSKAITEMWDRLHSSHGDDVLKKAKELLRQTRFEKLNALLEEAEWKIEDELNTLFNKKD